MHGRFFVVGTLILAALGLGLGYRLTPSPKTPPSTTSSSASSSSPTRSTTTTSSTTPTITTTTTTVAESAHLACAEHIVATWSVKQLANETISVSINGLQIGAMGPAARDGYGGILLFGATASSDFAATVAALQRETPDHESMLVMTDQEGGGIERLTNLVATLPWAQTMGKNLTPVEITAEGLRVGTSMKAAGINTDLAPVADVDGRAVEPGENDPDGFRSFSGVPAKAAADVVAFAKGLREAGVLAVVKHFPGLGGSNGDTDYRPAATLPWTTLMTTGLVPFRAAIESGVTALMMSNASVPGLTSLPASISPVVYHYVRDELGFGGLIVTDSLSAGALSAIHLGVPAASAKAITAGADMVLAGSPPSPAASLQLAAQTSSALQEAEESGTLALSTLQSAAAQVLASVNTLNCPTTSGPGA
jgi:beta-N-acetylhexosaminidase